MKKKSPTKIIIPILCTLLFLALLGVALYWNHYLNKYILLKKYETPQHQELYVLGSFHKDHLKPIYQYCMDEDVTIKMIDYWKVTNDFQPGTSNDFRDNMINENIDAKLSGLEEGARVLVICGCGHLDPQNERFISKGYIAQKPEGVQKLLR